MKAILKISILFLFINCKAQENILPWFKITMPPNDINLPDYSKDTDNDFGPYVGVWKWQNGNDSLTITFNTIIHASSSPPDPGPDFYDQLVGEYKYVENNVMLVNSHPLLQQTSTNGVPNIASTYAFDNTITASRIITHHRHIPDCPECAPNTRFIILDIGDPTKPDLHGILVVGRFIENGIEKMRAYISYTFNYSGSPPPSNYSLTIPNGVYTFIKQ